MWKSNAQAVILVYCGVRGRVRERTWWYYHKSVQIHLVILSKSNPFGPNRCIINHHVPNIGLLWTSYIYLMYASTHPLPSILPSVNPSAPFFFRFGQFPPLWSFLWHFRSCNNAWMRRRWGGCFLFCSKRVPRGLKVRLGWWESFSGSKHPNIQPFDEFLSIRLGLGNPVRFVRCEVNFSPRSSAKITPEVCDMNRAPIAGSSLPSKHHFWGVNSLLNFGGVSLTIFFCLGP